jgi:glutathione peroxidase
MRSDLCNCLDLKPAIAKSAMVELTGTRNRGALPKAGGGYPGWNFHKYLIGRDGQVIEGFGSRVKPDDAKLAAKIDAALSAN